MLNQIVAHTDDDVLLFTITVTIIVDASIAEAMDDDWDLLPDTPDSYALKPAGVNEVEGPEPKQKACSLPRTVGPTAAAPSTSSPSPASSTVYAKWSRSKHAWTKSFLWLTACCGEDGRFALHCASCDAAGLSPVFDAPSLQRSHFQQHENTWLHRHATDTAAALMTDDGGNAAPPEEAFLDVLTAFRNNRSHGDQGVHGAGKRWKITKMKWCLAEAQRDISREYLRKAESITLHQDAQKGRLALRVQTCGADLAPASCFLGTANVVKDYTNNSEGIAQATLTVIKDHSTPRSCPPHVHGNRPEPVLDVGLMTHICNHVEVFNSDAAADEQLAGRMLRGSSQRQQQDCGGQDDGIFPNCIVVSKDKPHGARRSAALS